MHHNRDVSCTATHHGTPAAAHHHGCTCATARAAKAAYETQREAAAAAGTPYATSAETTRFHLEALAYVFGWTPRDVATRCGVSRRTVESVARGRAPTVYRRTAGPIAALYERLHPVHPQQAAANRAVLARELGVPDPYPAGTVPTYQPIRRAS